VYEHALSKREIFKGSGTKLLMKNFRQENYSAEDGTKEANGLVITDKIPAVPRKRKLSEFLSELFRGRKKCSEFRRIVKAKEKQTFEISRNEHFLPRNNKNRSESIPRNFLEHKDIKRIFWSNKSVILKITYFVFLSGPEKWSQWFPVATAGMVKVCVTIRLYTGHCVYCTVHIFVGFYGFCRFFAQKISAVISLHPAGCKF
jgi:hypothetical protein